ncbi:uncharacterized protein BX664DRAFT_322587 [Halteromyces radiatus]|uniref:uncharacterized protein n=1 Tax=Halteromyces radiatus TaxID=101107 RepID=UPI00221FE79C|nr:uncharacterized protein BX664DRAFT_322587 [Halteromyces radiatus]KAI8099991.1 hypothetical protein BX664DRAFT_322587 [Halteromyces radiatus]
MTSGQEKEYERLIELQRREMELLAQTREFEDDLSDDDYNDTRLVDLRQAVTVPDMRFEKQFERTVATLKANGASNTTIFLSAVIKDQVVMQFISGFTWCLAGHAWRWLRLRNQRVNNNKESYHFLRGIKYGLSRWAS